MRYENHSLAEHGFAGHLAEPDAGSVRVRSATERHAAISASSTSAAARIMTADMYLFGGGQAMSLCVHVPAGCRLNCLRGKKGDDVYEDL